MVRDSKTGSTGNKTFMSLSVTEHSYQVHVHSRGSLLLPFLGCLFLTESMIFLFVSVKNIFWMKKSVSSGASLVAQWLRICLPMQGTRVRALVWEEPTCRGATKPVCHNYWACALEPASHNSWAHVPQLLKPARLEPVLRNKRSHRNEKPTPLNKE